MLIFDLECFMQTLRVIAVTLFLMALTLTAVAQDIRNIIAFAAEGLRTGNLSLFGPRVIIAHGRRSIT
jgi:hypothetical protein